MSTGVDVSGIRRALDTLAAQRIGHEKTIEDGLRRREEIASAPLAAEDIARVLLAECDRMTEAARSQLERSIEQIRSRPQKSLWTRAPIGIPSDGEGAGRFIAGLLGPVFKKAVTDALKARNVEGDGMPMTERAAKIQAIDAKIEAAESALAELRQQAEAAGLS